jgi:hypothetical protein
VPEVPKRGWPEAEPQPSPEQMQMAAAALAQEGGSWFGSGTFRDLENRLFAYRQIKRMTPETIDRMSKEQAKQASDIEQKVRGKDIEKMEEEMFKMSPKQLRELGVKFEPSNEGLSKEDLEAHSVKLLSGMRGFINPERFSEAQKRWPESKNIEHLKEDPIGDLLQHLSEADIERMMQAQRNKLRRGMRR